VWLLSLCERSAAGERLPSAGEDEGEPQAKVHTASESNDRNHEPHYGEGHAVGVLIAAARGPTHGLHSAAPRQSAADRTKAGTGTVAMTAKGALLALAQPGLTDGELGRNATAADRNATDAEELTNSSQTPQMKRIQLEPEADHALHHLQLQPPERITWATPMVRLIYAIAGGTGASVSGQATVIFKADLIHRMRMQDTSVMLLMIVVYFLTLSVTANVAFHRAANSSRIEYYADPRYHRSAVEGHDVEAFVEAFGQPPKNVYLHVAGLGNAVEDMPGTLQYRGGSYRVDFTFALDISPWVVREDCPGADQGSGGTTAEVALEDGIVAADLDQLRQFLEFDDNPLATVELEKEISWPRWEELATNIKHQIRQCGYDGCIGVDRTRHESVRVYKNEQWANFMHSRTLKVVLALSVVGWLAYVPFMWLRCTTLRVRCMYRVSIGIRDYWQLIADRLCAQGFQPVDSSVLGNGRGSAALHRLRPSPAGSRGPSDGDRSSEEEDGAS